MSNVYQDEIDEYYKCTFCGSENSETCTCGEKEDLLNDDIEDDISYGLNNGII